MGTTIEMTRLAEILTEKFNPPGMPFGYVAVAANVQVKDGSTKEIVFNDTEVVDERDAYHVPGEAGDKAKARMLAAIKTKGTDEMKAALDEYEAARRRLRKVGAVSITGDTCLSLPGLGDGDERVEATQAFGVALGKVMGYSLQLSQVPDSDNVQMARLNAIARGAYTTGLGPPSMGSWPRWASGTSCATGRPCSSARRRWRSTGPPRRTCTRTGCARSTERTTTRPGPKPSRV
jgi:hypothetical protein